MITIYHNPRCSKSRQTLALLHEQKIEPTIIEYIKNPLTKKELQNILKMLDMQPSELIRKNETIYKELKPQTESEILAAMVAHPKLIQRPIVVKNNTAVLGRPPENILTLFK